MAKHSFPRQSIFSPTLWDGCETSGEFIMQITKVSRLISTSVNKSPTGTLISPPLVELLWRLKAEHASITSKVTLK
jgi:hypothetical protein